jgi:hypothetical protein
MSCIRTTAPGPRLRQHLLDQQGRVPVLPVQGVHVPQGQRHAQSAGRRVIGAVRRPEQGRPRADHLLDRGLRPLHLARLGAVPQSRQALVGPRVVPDLHAEALHTHQHLLVTGHLAAEHEERRLGALGVQCVQHLSSTAPRAVVEGQGDALRPPAQRIETPLGPRRCASAPEALEWAWEQQSREVAQESPRPRVPLVRPQQEEGCPSASMTPRESGMHPVRDRFRLLSEPMTALCTSTATGQPLPTADPCASSTPLRHVTTKSRAVLSL